MTKRGNSDSNKGFGQNWTIFAVEGQFYTIFVHQETIPVSGIVEGKFLL